MRYEVTVNNYMIGSRVKSTPTHKIISKEVIAKNKIRLIYELDSIREKESIERILAKKLFEVK